MDNYQLITLIWVREGQIEALHDYERQAAPIMERHGGSLISAVEPTVLLGWDEPQPHEIHVVEFPSQGAFEAFRSDPDLEPLIELRSQAVRRAIVVGGVTLDYLHG
jgi:uncharacterized protein (DUF1330 family)